MKIFNYVNEIALVITLCAVIAMTIMGIDITEPMNNISLMVIGAFFGSQVPKNGVDKKEVTSV